MHFRHVQSYFAFLHHFDVKKGGTSCWVALLLPTIHIDPTKGNTEYDKLLSRMSLANLLGKASLLNGQNATEYIKFMFSLGADQLYQSVYQSLGETPKCW